jgi:hypothetical protein
MSLLGSCERRRARADEAGLHQAEGDLADDVLGHRTSVVGDGPGEAQLVLENHRWFPAPGLGRGRPVGGLGEGDPSSASPWSCRRCLQRAASRPQRDTGTSDSDMRALPDLGMPRKPGQEVSLGNLTTTAVVVGLVRGLAARPVFPRRGIQRLRRAAKTSLTRQSHRRPHDGR